jgi:hypothetical protein
MPPGRRHHHPQSTSDLLWLLGPRHGPLSTIGDRCVWTFTFQRSAAPSVGGSRRSRYRWLDVTIGQLCCRAFTDAVGQLRPFRRLASQLRPRSFFDIISCRNRPSSNKSATTRLTCPLAPAAAVTPQLGHSYVRIPLLPDVVRRLAHPRLFPALDPLQSTSDLLFRMSLFGHLELSSMGILEDESRQNTPSLLRSVFKSLGQFGAGHVQTSTSPQPAFETRMLFICRL